jgi:hypothetical protein
MAWWSWLVVRFGRVADDVDHMRGELVKPRVTVDCHVPSA